MGDCRPSKKTNNSLEVVLSTSFHTPVPIEPRRLCPPTHRLPSLPPPSGSSRVKPQVVGGLLLLPGQFLVGDLAVVVFVVGIVIGRVGGGLPEGPRLVEDAAPLRGLPPQKLVVDHALIPVRASHRRTGEDQPTNQPIKHQAFKQAREQSRKKTNSAKEKDEAVSQPYRLGGIGENIGKAKTSRKVHRHGANAVVCQNRTLASADKHKHTRSLSFSLFLCLRVTYQVTAGRSTSVSSIVCPSPPLAVLWAARVTVTVLPEPTAVAPPLSVAAAAAATSDPSLSPAEDADADAVATCGCPSRHSPVVPSQLRSTGFDMVDCVVCCVFL